MTSKDLRQKFLDFFENKGHKILPGASLIPENDPSVLFTTAGMQQFKRYYAAPDEAPAKTVVTCQPCVRTSDIDEVGDETHLTFFEMLGNFSFNDPASPAGGYFKKETIEYAWEFLTEVLNIEKSRIHATYFEGDEIAPVDNESLEILQSIEGLKKVEPQGEDNFWSLGTENSPGGPTVEFYVDGVEVWNLVFNEYVFKNGKYEKSEYRGVDTGLGLERMLVVYNGLHNVYETDLLKPIIDRIVEVTGEPYDGKNKLAMRRIVDHYRASVEIIKAGIRPGKNGRESVLRTLLRVAFIELNAIMPTMRQQSFSSVQEAIADSVKNMFRDWTGFISQLISEQNEEIKKIIIDEYKSYLSLERFGLVYLKKFENSEIITGEIIFRGKDTFGLSPDGVAEMWKRFGAKIDPNWEKQYKEALRKHQDLSRTASAGMFKGGLTTQSEQATKYHTATHLLLAALRQVLGSEIHQRGSNITDERLRFDFSYLEKLTDEQIKKVEDLVNAKIAEDLPVSMEEMSLEDAQKCGVIGEFGEKYGYKVKVYSMGDFSREICGGPHVECTGVLGHFKITKEESSSAGVRRIKAVLE